MNIHKINTSASWSTVAVSGRRPKTTQTKPSYSANRNLHINNYFRSKSLASINHINGFHIHNVIQNQTRSKMYYLLRCPLKHTTVLRPWPCPIENVHSSSEYSSDTLCIRNRL